MTRGYAPEVELARTEAGLIFALAARPMTRGELFTYAVIPAKHRNGIGIRRAIDALIKRGVVEETMVDRLPDHRGFPTAIRHAGYQLRPVRVEEFSSLSVATNEL